MTQYTEKDMTPFFPAETVPERHGVYQTHPDTADLDETIYYQNWNGIFWGMYCANPWRAEAAPNAGQSSVCQKPQWRGLSFDPSKEAK